MTWPLWGRIWDLLARVNLWSALFDKWLISYLSPSTYICIYILCMYVVFIPEKQTGVNSSIISGPPSWFGLLIKKWPLGWEGGNYTVHSSTPLSSYSFVTPGRQNRMINLTRPEQCSIPTQCNWNNQYGTKTRWMIIIKLQEKFFGR